MGGTAGKMLLTLALAAMLALGLAACGGSGDSTQSTASTSGAQEAAKTTPGGGEQQDNQKQTGDGKGPAGKEGSGVAAGGGSSKGEGSASFRTPGGDNSIQNFGNEADPSERGVAESALSSYLNARAKGDWGGSCKYLAAAAVKPLEQLAASSPQLKGKGCAAIIGALSAQLPASSRANPASQGVAALRVEGDRGFALFHGPKGVNYFVPMVKEDGKWKVGALAPSEFP